MALIRVTVSVGLALAGLGVWSLVWGQLAGIAAWSLLLWRVTDWRPRRTTPRELVKPILSYGRGIVAVNLLAAVVHHADLLVVGRAFGATVLGLYQMAQKLPEATIILVIWTTGKVLFPAFAAVQKEPEVLRSAYLMALRYVSLLALPSALVFLFLAEPIVLLVFGESWHGAAPLLRAVGIACAFRALGSHAGDVLKATGRSSLLARLGVVKALILIPLLVVASGVSALAVAVALAAVTATSAAVNTAVVCRLNQLTMRDVATALRPSLQASAIFAAALLAIEALGLSSGGPLALAAGITASIGCYLLALGVASPDIYARAWQSFAGSPTLRRRVEVER